MILFDCPRCGRNIRVSDSAAGRNGTCNGCGRLIQVPEADPPDEPVWCLETESRPTVHRPPCPAPNPARKLEAIGGFVCVAGFVVAAMGLADTHSNPAALVLGGFAAMGGLCVFIVGRFQE